MCVNVLLNLLNVLTKRDNMRYFAEHFIVFSQKL